MKTDKSDRLHLAVLAVLLGSVVLVGCQKKDQPVAVPPAANETAPLPQANAAMPTANVNGVTDFLINRPDPWPTGRYKVEIMLDGALVQTREFEVK